MESLKELRTDVSLIAGRNDIEGLLVQDTLTVFHEKEQNFYHSFVSRVTLFTDTKTTLPFGIEIEYID